MYMIISRDSWLVISTQMFLVLIQLKRRIYSFLFIYLNFCLEPYLDMLGFNITYRNWIYMNRLMFFKLELIE